MQKQFAVLLCLCFACRTHAAGLVTKALQADAAGSGSSSAPILSADGSHVVFLSAAQNLTTNSVERWSFNIFERDLAAGKTALISAATNGAGADGFSAFPSVSGDGRYVAFVSDASNLTADDTNKAPDIFVRDVVAGTTALISAGTNGLTIGEASHGNPMISSNGQHVFFESNARLAGSDLNDAFDVFERNLLSGATIQVSARAGDAASSAKARLADVTPDGRRAAFIGTGSGEFALGAGGPDSDIYVRDMATNATLWASPLGGQLGWYRCTAAALSADGRFALVTAADSIGQSHVFRTDLDTLDVSLVSSNIWTNELPQISANGQYVLYEDGSSVFRWDASSGTAFRVNVATNGAITQGLSRHGRMSVDGNTVVFISSATGLVTNQPGAAYQVYARNMASGETILVTERPSGAASVFSAELANYSVAGNPAKIAFATSASDLAADDLNRASDVFVHNSTDGSAELISVREPTRQPRRTPAGHALVRASGVSSNGMTVAFTSYDTDLVSYDTNQVADGYAIVLPSGTTIGSESNGYPVRAAAVSGDGRYLIVSRNSSSLGASSLARYDVLAGTNQFLVLTGTRSRDGSAPAVNHDGSLVCIRTSSGLQIFNAAGGTNEIVIGGTTVSINGRDLQDAVLSPDERFLGYAVSTTLNVRDRANGQIQTITFNPESSTISFSANSRFMTFMSDMAYRRDLILKTNLSLGMQLLDTTISGDGRYVVGTTSNGLQQIVLIDCQTGRSNLLSAGRSGEPGNGRSRNPSISPDGRFVTYRTRASNIAAGGPTNVYQVVLRDLLRGTTTILSRSADGSLGNGNSGKPILSQDGSTVVFQSMADNLIGEDVNDRRDIFVATIAAPDSDGDGLDDEWEIAYFGGLARTGDDDFDADGVSDREEFIAGTDPTNIGSVFRVVKLQRLGDTSAQLMWTGNPSRSYAVEYKDDLNSTGWTRLSSAVTWSGETGAAVDATGGTNRFYRVVRLP